MVLTKSFAVAAALSALFLGTDAQSAGLPTRNATVGTTKVSFIPRGGQMMLTSTEASDRYLTCTMFDMTELDSFSKVTNNTIALVEKQEANWQPVTEAVLDKANDIQGYFTTYETAMILAKTEFTIANRASIPNGDLTATFSNKQKVKVPAMGLKFWIEIKNWPFISLKNSLRLAIRVTASLNGFVPNNVTVKNGTGPDSSQVVRINYMNGTKNFGYVDFPTFATLQPKNQSASLEGTITPISLSVQDVKDHGYDVILAFDAFDPLTTKILYDPVMYLYPVKKAPTGAAGSAAEGDTGASGSTSKEKQPASSGSAALHTGAAAMLLVGIISAMMGGAF